MGITWYKVYEGGDIEKYGHTPGMVRTIEAGKKLICLARTEKGFYALDDKCPHAGGRLGLGKCDAANYVICPVHRYRYNVENGRGAPGQGDYVDVYPVRIDADGLYIGIEKKSWWQWLF